MAGSLVITGHRDIADSYRGKVEINVRATLLLGEYDRIILGGAKGVDTIALRAAGMAKHEGNFEVIVMVPDRVGNQPEGSQIAIRRHADKVIELQKEITRADGWYSFKNRNIQMLNLALEYEGKKTLLAFCDGSPSGSQHAINQAKEKGFEVEVIEVQKYRR